MTNEHWNCLVQLLMPMILRYELSILLQLYYFSGTFTYMNIKNLNLTILEDDWCIWGTAWCIQWNVVLYVVEYWTSNKRYEKKLLFHHKTSYKASLLINIWTVAIEVLEKRIKKREGVPFLWRLLVMPFPYYEFLSILVRVRIFSGILKMYDNFIVVGSGERL